MPEPTSTHNTDLHFADYQAFERFRREEVLSQFPNKCAGCSIVELDTIEIAIEADNSEVTEEEAKEKAKLRGQQVLSSCTYGYSVRYGCGAGVLCRMG